MADNRDRVRMTLDLSPKLNAEIERLAAKGNRTKADVLRLGVDMLAAANTARDEGMSVGAWSEDKESRVRKEREFVGYF